MNGPYDPAIGEAEFNGEAFRRLAENPSRLVDVIPWCYRLNYSCIEPVLTIDPKLAMKVLNLFTDLSNLKVSERVRNQPHFFGFSKELA